MNHYKRETGGTLAKGRPVMTSMTAGAPMGVQQSHQPVELVKSALNPTGNQRVDSEIPNNQKSGILRPMSAKK